MDQELKNWIKENRYIIDAVIQTVNPGQKNIDDEEREMWILNHESLYIAARNAAVVD